MKTTDYYLHRSEDSDRPKARKPSTYSTVRTILDIKGPHDKFAEGDTGGTEFPTENYEENYCQCLSDVIFLHAVSYRVVQVKLCPVSGFKATLVLLLLEACGSLSLSVLV